MAAIAPGNSRLHESSTRGNENVNKTVCHKRRFEVWCWRGGNVMVKILCLVELMDAVLHQIGVEIQKSERSAVCKYVIGSLLF